MVPGGAGKAHAAVFALEPSSEGVGAARELSVHMLFERYAACALGRFRISVTSDPRAAAHPQALPPEIEDVLLQPPVARTEAHRNAMFDYFIGVAPQLAAGRKDIE